MEESSSSKASSVPPFLTKCYDMVEDPATDPIVSWSSNNDTFIIWDVTAFSRDLLPKYFKHSNFSSFIRQLNTYGFRKADPDRWEFANEGFIKGQRHLLKNISRKKHVQGPGQQKEAQQKMPVGACVEVGKFGLQVEVESLKRDKNVLMQELVKLRQQQQAAENKLLGLRKSLQRMEKAQQQMLSFLAMAMQSPGFLEQLLQQNENNWRMAGASKKRRLPALEQGFEGGEAEVSKGQIVMYQPPKNNTSKPLVMTVLNTDVSPKVDVNDFVRNDSMESPTGEGLHSLENDAQIIISGLLSDDLLEQLLVDSPFTENLVETELDAPESMNTGMDMDAVVHDCQLETSQNMDLLTEQMSLLASETNSRHEIL
ncbi:PREDICTED: heat stress transcription factor A-1-like isoform X2 [Nelumbo nucifera]|uniref:Heat stress transcription factor A-1-like isoform X2 n=1 Tax=Nelumbo nucifera TaxID=4432 RepID=A0A1U8BK47_NELNU|nr:PREDICTED: heat stress transcription factor A-1-like isoform X2 [Nelumbo nucifera]